MKKFITVLFVITLVLSFSGSVFAEDMPEGKAYPAGPIQKAERGFMNAVFGWTEIPKRIVDKTRETNPIKGVFLGLFQGTCKAFARTVSGAAELVTFPIGGYDKPAVLPDMPAAK
ncbi:MAG: exosortase system-associated protein, TIGR04073 family [Candidatus Aadella gelida]|nr:exosortase system-associated protein, TIGR04073 family [Candidatus Aadella gelida]